jgi:hypothetical protein
MAKAKYHREHGLIVETLALLADEEKRIEIHIPAEYARDGKPASFWLTVINETGGTRSFDVAVNRDDSVEAGFVIALIIRKPTNGELHEVASREELTSFDLTCAPA